MFGNDLTKHVKDLTMTNKLKRSESYYQSKYSNNKYSKDYAKSDKFILQMVSGDINEFENDIPTKQNAKNHSFSPEG